MSDPYIQELFAQRIGGSQYGKSVAIYKFEKIKRAKRQALADRPDRALVDFGIGENDEMAPEQIREVMRREIDLPENRGYADNGILDFQEAAAGFLKRNFGVELNPRTQIVHAIGSKPAYALLPACFINPGDVALVTVPGYPVAATWTRYLGGQVHALPLLPQNDYLPDLDSVPDSLRDKAKVLILNYPNSPTGRTATIEFYRRVVDFALENRLVVVQDAAHLMLTYGTRPLSFLETPGAMDVGVEVHSMSKGWHMIGWRMGFVAGNELIVRAFGDVKDNSDSGQFKAIQKAAAAALTDDSIWQGVRDKYERRLLALVEALRALGFEVSMPQGTYFLYAQAPRAATTPQGEVEFGSAEACSQWLIGTHGIVTVPFDDAGPHLRFSATWEAWSAGDLAVIDALRERLAGVTFRF